MNDETHPTVPPSISPRWMEREIRDHINYLCGGYFPEGLVSGSNFLAEADKWAKALTALSIGQTVNPEELDRERKIPYTSIYGGEVAHLFRAEYRNLKAIKAEFIKTLSR